MEPRINLITLGVSDLKKSRAFYEKLGWKASSASQEEVAFFQGKGIVLGLFGRHALAEDAKVSAEGSGFKSLSLAYNTHTKEEVDAILEEARAAGAKITKPAQEVFWGGYNGYFTDPDGHLWEVAWAPQLELTKDGELRMPE